MKTDFTWDKRDLKKLQKFFKKSPELYKPATANVLTSLAVKTRKLDIRNIDRSMIIRNQRFVESSLRFQKAKNTRIENQVAYAYSVKRPNFSGWAEQETGKPDKKDRSFTLAARGGNKRSTVKSKARLRNKQIYKPSQFNGNTRKDRFMMMMRAIGSKGGGQFLLRDNLKTKRGQLRRGLYQLKKSKITMLQDLTHPMRIRRNQWRTQSIKQLKYGNDIAKIWRSSINHVRSGINSKK